MSATTTRPAHGSRTRTLRTVAAALALLLLTGCGLRWETPDPVPPTADATEQARQRAAAQSVGLSVAAAQAISPDQAAGPDQAATAAVLERIAAQADAHAQALGGLAPEVVTEDDDEATPSGPATPGPAPASPAVGVSTVLELLAEGYDAARGDAVDAVDAPLARLLASIATARLLAARDLATAAGLPMPELPPAAPTDLSGLLGEPADTATAATMTLAHDQVAYAYEVMAARTDADLRAQASAQAQVHRTAARDWAVAGGIAGSPSDPRRPAYTLPPELLASAEGAQGVAHELEAELATSYASLVGRTGPGARAAAVDAFTALTATAQAWGDPPTAFPGLPEQSA